jgi:hypothetical protein
MGPSWVVPRDYATIPTGVPSTADLPHDSAGERLNVSVWCLFSAATVFLLLRVYCRFLGRRNLWWDDWILIAGWVSFAFSPACAQWLVDDAIPIGVEPDGLGIPSDRYRYLTRTQPADTTPWRSRASQVVLIGDAVLVSVMVHNGMGEHTYDITPQQFEVLGPLIVARATLTIIATVWTKTSFAVTVLRLAEGWLKWVLWYIIISMNIAMGLSAIFGYVQCTPIAKSINHLLPGTCWDANVLIDYSIFSGGEFTNDLLLLHCFCIASALLVLLRGVTVRVEDKADTQGASCSVLWRMRRRARLVALVHHLEPADADQRKDWRCCCHEHGPRVSKATPTNLSSIRPGC